MSLKTMIIILTWIKTKIEQKNIQVNEEKKFEREITLRNSESKFHYLLQKNYFSRKEKINCYWLDYIDDKQFCRCDYESKVL